MNPMEYLEKARKNSQGKPAPIKEIWPEQAEMAQVLFESMMMAHVVQVTQGPTGLGKTLVILAVAAALNDAGKRVLVAAPTHNHIIDNFKQDGALVFDAEPPTLYGLSHDRYARERQQCPRGLAACSKPGSRECEAHVKTCKIAREYIAAKTAPTVFTTHALVASKPSIVSGFDALLVDESHGLPNTMQGQNQKTITGSTIPSLAARQTDAEVKDLLEQAASDYDRIKRLGGRAPKTMGTRVLDSMKRASSLVKDDNPLWEWRFFQTVETIAKDGDMTVGRFGGKHDWPEQLSVGLVSATIEDPRAHAKDCGFEKLVLRPKIQIDNDRFRLRFERRPIFAIIDGPRLAKGDSDNYGTFRQEANELIATLIGAVPDEVTLILCQNKDDAHSIQAFLHTVPPISPRLTVLPDDPDDADSLEVIIQTDVASGKNVIIATSSSKLWEGANVPRLRYLILDALPYRKPTTAELEATGPKAAQSWKGMKRFMLNRVQQGIGRLVRHEGDWGVAVIIDERFYSNRAQFVKELPKYITSPQILKWTTKAETATEISKMAKLLASGKSARKDQDLFEAMKKLGDPK